ncbi:hypothetical protein [Profundibacterium mesophilum]|uniref:Uncharacterized protein n=1 Tax=Profundibacterium mesophilum KAUST100406-0324 TaxID=1037889 RepID=A0A921NWL5_9RHOB|nr:hypothetical protein [Profundibacterium mesophilum]KAF0674888.1 hypothetical protein PMES_02770 [Profundibacterium mesophilum KAUST100406-0324]
MRDEDRELNRLLQQTTLRLARETAELQARPLSHVIRPAIGFALGCICLGISLAIGLTLLGKAL